MRQFVTILAIVNLFMAMSYAQEYQPDHRTIFVSASGKQPGDGSFAKPFQNLQTAIDSAKSGDEIFVQPGRYTAKPSPYIEDLCGNCLDARTRVNASRGFVIEGKAITIKGVDPDSVVLVTSAGYGVLFLDSWGSTIEGCQITGGVRDKDGSATDAGIVAKFSRVTVRTCKIINNDYRDTSVVVGVGGVFGREGSELFIEGNEIFNNGWDGIALYRGAKAFIADNRIDKGRGAGIGITWDAQATVLRNRVSRYWKGIGSFGTSRAVVRNNIVLDCLGWGIIATGTSFMEATNNLIYRNGNCGFANWGDRVDSLGPRGVFVNNIVYNNGWRDEWVCPCVGVWMLGNPRDFVIANNDVFTDSALIAAERTNADKRKDPKKPKYATNYGDSDDLTGKHGNLSVNPMFADTITFRLLPTSPLINAGDSILTNLDGSKSDIGVWGGNSTKR
jgi:hypothetical protein